MSTQDDLIKLVRETTPAKIAEEICNVQPMDPKIWIDLYNSAKSEKDLIAEGYEPIDKLTKLMWVKK